MNPRTLAKALRRRQLRAKIVPAAAVCASSDEQILNDYVTCCRCRGSIFADPAAAINNSQDVSEFLKLTNMALAAHRCADSPMRKAVKYIFCLK